MAARTGKAPAKRETGLFKRQGADHFEYDFRVSGHRFCGTTECTARRDAEAFVRQKKIEARASLADRQAPTVTFAVASSRWWHERGQYCSRPAVVQDMLARLQEWIGLNTRLTEITNDRVAAIVAKRRAEGVSAGTVNRSFTEPLRRILKRAETTWGHDVARIDWRQHLLAEPQVRIREITPAEQAAIIKHLKEDFRPLVQFSILSGVRREGCLSLKWSAIDWGARKIHIQGKGGQDYTLPLSNALRGLLWPLQGRHPEFVFCYRRERAQGKVRRGTWAPINADRLEAAFRAARKAAGIPNSRDDQRKGLRFHDTRHTAGSRILRATRNLKIAQQLLGHKDIESTLRYVHVLDSELLEGIDAAAALSAGRDAGRKKGKT